MAPSVAGSGDALRPRPTKAQVEALRWLEARYGRDSFHSSALLPWYEERARAEHEAGVDRGYGWRPTTNRKHAWRRTSGRVLGAMERAGLVVYAGSDRYTARYAITDAGREAIA